MGVGSTFQHIGERKHKRLKRWMVCSVILDPQIRSTCIHRAPQSCCEHTGQASPNTQITNHTYANTQIQIPVYIEFLNPVVNILAKLHISVCWAATFILVRGDVNPDVRNVFLGIRMYQMCFWGSGCIRCNVKSDLTSVVT